MANCPKCGRKLTILDWKPNCPGCGVNLVYYGMEERLLAEADAAEAEHARLQKRIDRLKASFVGSKLTIIRIILSVLPIATLLLPLCSVSYSGPFIEATTTNVNAIEIYNIVSSLDFDGLFTMIGSSVLGSSFIGYLGALACILLSLVFVILSLVMGVLVVLAEPAIHVLNAQVEEVTDANGFKAVKVTFDSGILFATNKADLNQASKNSLAKFSTVPFVIGLTL